MAFNRDNMNLVGPGAGQGSKTWSYISLNSDDAIADIDDADYFLEMADELRAGDIIHVTCVATGSVLNPTTLTSVTHLVVLTAVGKKDGGTATVTTFANALSLA